MGCLTLVIPPDQLLPIKNACELAKTNLQAMKLKKQSYLLDVNRALVGLEAKKVFMDAYISEARDKMKVIPKDAISKCSQASAINNILASVTIDPLENMYNMVFDIGRLTAAKTAASIEVKEVDDAIDYLTGIIDDINAALG
jgi:hypothetical protein